MTLRHGSTAVLFALILTTVAHGQVAHTTGSSVFVTLSSLSGTVTATQPANTDTDLRATIFRSIFDMIIQDLFTSLRGSLGLPTTSTGATDPLEPSGNAPHRPGKRQTHQLSFCQREDRFRTRWSSRSWPSSMSPQARQYSHQGGQNSNPATTIKSIHLRGPRCRAKTRVSWGDVEQRVADQESARRCRHESPMKHQQNQARVVHPPVPPPVDLDASQPQYG